ncbi:DUF134 domain-containing protein [Thermogladius sp. 4427co]|uniref:DUF134 domain-containing protein n=1 Tax=Thermogladius sp. 4427co TaxID=3450718 RepID=UPI003F7AB5C9
MNGFKGRGYGRKWRGGRPPVPRRVEFYYGNVVFVPSTLRPPYSMLNGVVLFHDEVEAFRLAYLEGLNVREASLRMNVSEATYWRILDSARRKIAEALVDLKPIIILPREQSPETTPKTVDGERES